MNAYNEDGYIVDLYKGGEGRIYVMIADSKGGAQAHVDIDFAVLSRGLAALLPILCDPLPPDEDLNEGEASMRPSDVVREPEESPATP